MENHPRPPKNYTDLKIEVPADDKAAWLLVAAERKTTFDDWVSQVLNRAAKNQKQV